jgi:hypothetical protein
MLRPLFFLTTCGQPHPNGGVMMQKVAHLLIVCGSIVFFSVGLFAESGAHPSLTIRIYNRIGTPKTQVSEAIETADRILRGAGIDPSWHYCDVPAAAGPCSRALGINEFMVRFVSAPVDDHGNRFVSFGYSLIDTKTGSGALATVFADRVVDASETLRTHAGTLLGRVVAHEMGHLLLGSAGHTAGGLMRDEWSSAFIRSNVDEDWSFRVSESELMRTALFARHEANSRLAVSRVK